MIAQGWASGPSCLLLSLALGFSDAMAWDPMSTPLALKYAQLVGMESHAHGASSKQWGQEPHEKVLSYGFPLAMVKFKKKMILI